MISALLVFAGGYLLDRNIHGKGDVPRIPGVFGGDKNNGNPQLPDGAGRGPDLGVMAQKIAETLTAWGIQFKIGPEDGVPGAWWVATPDQAIDVARKAIEACRKRLDIHCEITEGRDEGGWYALLTPIAPANTGRAGGQWDHPVHHGDGHHPRALPEPPPAQPRALPGPQEPASHSAPLAEWVRETPQTRAPAPQTSAPAPQPEPHPHTPGAPSLEDIPEDREEFDAFFGAFDGDDQVLDEGPEDDPEPFSATDLFSDIG